MVNFQKLFLRLQFQFILLKKYLQKYYIFVLGAVAVVLVGIIIFQQLSISSLNFLKPSVSEGIVGTYTGDNLPVVVTSLLSDGLVKLDQKGLPQPNLVQGWEVNKEATSYTFKLKDNLHWIDGTPLKASDLTISIQDAEIQTPDDKTLTFKLADSFSPLPTLLTKPLLKKNTLIGFGPYKVDSIEKSGVFIKKIVLVSLDNNLPNVVFRFYPSEKIAKSGLRIGEVQSLLGLNSPEDFILEKPFSLISKTNFSKLVAIFYDTKDPILSDRNLRLALSFASPSIKTETEAKTSIPPTSWAFNSDVRDYLDNPDQAKQYLAKVKKGKNDPITLTVTNSLKEVGEKVVAEWNKQGFNIKLRVESGIPQNFQALLISQNIPLDPDQYSLWHSTQVKTNISQYSSPAQYSPRVDKDLEDGRKSTDLEVRKQKYQDMQKVLLDDAPATYLFFPKFNVVYLKKIESNLKKVLDLQLPDLQLIN
ncbi:ABC transporter substrate-binding protein [Candidatus Daviesbacteria bacterium]|nr:ABC transporter substrate-binding protein [Candidatus Daviesbacteria bacterium]